MCADVSPLDSLCSALWAFAKLGRQPKRGLVEGISENIQECISTYRPQNISNLLWVRFLSTALH